MILRRLLLVTSIIVVLPLAAAGAWWANCAYAEASYARLETSLHHDLPGMTREEAERYLRRKGIEGSAQYAMDRLGGWVDGSKYNPGCSPCEIDLTFEAALDGSGRVTSVTTTHSVPSCL